MLFKRFVVSHFNKPLEKHWRPKHEPVLERFFSLWTRLVLTLTTELEQTEFSNRINASSVR